MMVNLKKILNIYVAATAAAITGILYQLGILSTVFYITLYVGVGLSGLAFGFLLVACSGEKRRPLPQETETVAKRSNSRRGRD